MRRRRNSEEEEGSEMEIDNEEKSEHHEDDAASSQDKELADSEGEDRAPPIEVQNTFLDSFYGLSSEDPRDRVHAAQNIIHSCLLGPSANSKDAAYTFRRLLNGLCSGRAAARQGNASALANFLKVAFHLKKMDEIRQEGTQTVDPSASILTFVRERLLAATDPSQSTGKKKGSEERDYHFGRLFGILSVVRSGVLLPSEKNGEEEFSDSLAVSSGFGSDLAELFWHRKWMREPAAHGVATLLKIFLDKVADDACCKIADRLVKNVVAPKLLLVSGSGDDTQSNHEQLFGSYCAEQIGIAAFIQSHEISYAEGVPFPLDKPVLSTESVPHMAQALGETSNVVQPRIHFVWDACWCYLTESTSKKDAKNGKGIQRQLRSKCLVGEDIPKDILDALIRHVVMHKLLKLEVDSVEVERAESAGKATHGRRSLAMCLVRNLSGALFASSLTGPTQILLDEDSLEHVVLGPQVVRSSFFAVLCAGKKVSHLLKPLAVAILESMIDTTTEDQGYDRTRRLALVRALLKCEVRFDARTRTSTVAALLNYNSPVESGTGKTWIEFWNNYRKWLESQLLEGLAAPDGDKSSATVTGLIELFSSLGKSILRVEAGAEEDRAALKAFREATVRGILSLFMAAAFFDCSKLEGPKKPDSKKKKKKKGSQEHPILEYGAKLRDALGEAGVVERDVRSVASSRFFNLASDFLHMETHQPKGSPEAITEKDTKMLSILTGFCDDWKLLEQSGAIRFVGSTQEDKDDESTDESVDPDEIIMRLRSDTDRVSNSLKSDNSVSTAKIRCCRGITILAHVLYLHRLTSENPDDMTDNDDPDIDEEDDEEEICNALDGLRCVMSDFLERSDEGANPLLGLSEICANTLSSPLGSGSIGRGASPKMVREAVKFAWDGGLRLASELTSEDYMLFDSEVVATLLKSIGAFADEDGGSDDEGDSEEGESDGEEEEEDDSDADSDANVFGQAAELVDGSDDMDVDAVDDDAEIELDASMVQSVLEEDSDASVNAEELEHHEGADAALAKLIALKQASRKAGQQAREKIEISLQLRCTFLFEILFSHPEAWNQLLQSDILLAMIMPLLRHRQKLEKSLDKMTDSSSKSGIGDKRALLDRLSNLIQQKLGKLKIDTAAQAADIDQHAKVAKLILNEVKRAGSKDQIACCSASLVLVLRTVKSVSDKVAAASVLGDAIEEWSTVKATRLQTFFFDDFMLHMPSLAQATLLVPLKIASQEARSDFLKAEAYRLLASLLSTRPNPTSPSELEKCAMTSILNESKSLLESLDTTFQNAEMRKAKRVREPLKMLEKLLPYLASSGVVELEETLSAVKKLVEDLGSSESQGVKNACTKLLSEIDETISSAQTKKNEDKAPPKEQAPQTQNSESGKKKKKKKKKKK